MSTESTAPSTSRTRSCPIDRLLFGDGVRSPVGDLGFAVMRIGIGLYLALGHGYGKIFGEDRFGPSPEFIEGVSKLGFPAPELFAWMAALTEFLGGLAIAAGVLTRPAALGIIGTMAVAAFRVHADDPWVGSPGKELALLYLLPSLAILAIGGGRFSVDAALRRLCFRK